MVLSAIIFVSASLSIFAASLDRSNLGTIKVGYIDNASGLSETLTDDDIITDYDLSYNLSAEGLQIAGTIKGEAFSVNATVETTNYHGNALIYLANDSMENYDVLFVGVARELEETVLFFRDFANKNPIYTNAIILYMQPKDTDDFVIIEIFIDTDFVLSYKLSNNVTHDWEKCDSLYWFMAYITPVIEIEEVPVTLDVSTYYECKHTCSYNIGDYDATAYLILRMNYSVEDIAVGGSGESVCYYSVEKAYVDCESDYFDQDHQDYLKIENANITFCTATNMVVTSQTAIRSGIYSSNSFVVPFGVCIGASSEKGTVALTNSSYSSMGNSTHNFTNTSANAIITTEVGALPSGYYLNDTGDTYGFTVKYEDLGKTDITDNVKIIFYYTMQNYYNPAASFPNSIARNVTVKVG